MCPTPTDAGYSNATTKQGCTRGKSWCDRYTDDEQLNKHSIQKLCLAPSKIDHIVTAFCKTLNP
jgi:hypothetical protein